METNVQCHNQIHYFRSMKMTEVRIQVQDVNKRDELLGMLSLDGLQGTQEDDDTLIIYWDTDSADFADMLKICAPHHPHVTEVVEENWNATWESNFTPVRISERIGVRADFHPPFEDCQYDLVITPKMSFGTGHHETTHMMLSYLDETDCAQSAVLDFGCGTGVLAILASRKGASPVDAIDHDPWSVENSLENCQRNACINIQVSQNGLDTLQGPYHIILANINLNVLLDTLPNLFKLLKSGGSLFLSGILQTDRETMENALLAHGFSKISEKTQGNWLAIHAIKN